MDLQAARDLALKLRRNPDSRHALRADVVQTGTVKIPRRTDTGSVRYAEVPEYRVESNGQTAPAAGALATFPSASASRAMRGRRTGRVVRTTGTRALIEYQYAYQRRRSTDVKSETWQPLNAIRFEPTTRA